MDRVRDPEEEAPLVSIEQWRERIVSRVVTLPPRELPLDDAWGCVLATDERAPADLPAFTSSAMDGFAVRSTDISSAGPSSPAGLRIVGEVRMGQPATVAVGSGEAVVVPTGGVVPDGADAVVPVELCAAEDDRVLVLRSLPAGKHVRPAGEDVGRGDLLVGAGQRLRAPDLGALAAAGRATVSVYPPARVGIVSTGDELVRAGTELDTAEVYDANGAIIAAAVQEAGAIPIDGGIARDEPAALVAALDGVVGDVDVLVCSGGVSAGERDPVKRAFLQGGDIEFANVAMQPGRPQAFGSYKGKPFFGLPGNPVSVFVSFVVFVHPAVMKLMGRTDRYPEVTATLTADLDAPRTRTRYARVRVRREGDRVLATPEGGHQSNLLATFARADGLAVVPAATRLAAGEACRVLLVRDLA